MLKTMTNVLFYYLHKWLLEHFPDGLLLLFDNTESEMNIAWKTWEEKKNCITK